MTGEYWRTQKIPKRAADKQVQKRAADEQVQKRAADEQVWKRAADEQVPKRAADEQVRKRAADEQVRKRVADDQVRKRAVDEQEHIWHNYDSAKATIWCATRGGEISDERIRRVYGMKAEKFYRTKVWPHKKIKVVKEGADDYGLQEKWPPPVAQLLAAQNRVQSRHHL